MGKEYIPSLGVYMRPPAGYTRDQNTWFGYRSPDGSHVFRFEWPNDMDKLLADLSAGIDAGDVLIWSNGQTEQVAPDKTAFGSKMISKATQQDTEYRYNVMCMGGVRGTFVATAVVGAENAGKLESAKQRLVSMLTTLEIPTPEQMAATIGTRSRDADETRLRQALMGKAIVKLTTENHSSDAGSAYFYSTERFQLCANGNGLYTYRSNSNVSSTGRDDSGDRYETATYHDNDGNTLAGPWDVVRSGSGFSLMILAGRSSPESWPIAPNGGDGYLIGGKRFLIAGSDSEYGPRCQ